MKKLILQQYILLYNTAKSTNALFCIALHAKRLFQWYPIGGGCHINKIDNKLRNEHIDEAQYAVYNKKEI